MKHSLWILDCWASAHSSVPGQKKILLKILSVWSKWYMLRGNISFLDSKMLINTDSLKKYFVFSYLTINSAIIMRGVLFLLFFYSNILIYTNKSTIKQPDI